MLKFTWSKITHVPLHCSDLARCSLLKPHTIAVAASHLKPSGIIFRKKAWPFATKLQVRTSTSETPILLPNRLVAGLVTGWVHDPSACDPAAVLGTVWPWLLLSNDKHCTSFLIVSASSDLSLKPAVWALGLPCLFEKTNCNIFFSHTAKDEVDWIQDIRVYLAELEVTSYLTHSICSHG